MTTALPLPKARARWPARTRVLLLEGDRYLGATLQPAWPAEATVWQLDRLAALLADPLFARRTFSVERYEPPTAPSRPVSRLRTAGLLVLAAVCLGWLL